MFCLFKEDSVLFYFHACFAKNDMLDSYSSVIPEECGGNSSMVTNASLSSPSKPKEKEKSMVTPARVLADAFMGAFPARIC